MKRNRRLYQKIVILFLCMGMLTGCGRKGTDQSSLIVDKKEKSEISTQGITGQDEIHTQETVLKQTEAEKIETAVLTLEEEELEIREQGMAYGNLNLTFPTKITVTVVESEKEGTTVEWDGAQKWDEYASSLIAPRLRFLHYRAEYGKLEANANISLLSALLDLFPDAEIRVGYTSEYSKERSFLIEDGLYEYYALMRGKDLYLVEEMRAEKNYAFWHIFGEQNFVCWKDSNEKIPRHGEFETRSKYMKVRPEEGYSFLCRFSEYDSTERTMVFWREGYYDVAYQQIDYVGVIDREDFRDLNFDGFPDWDDGTGEKFYLWDHGKKKYVASESSGGEGFPWTYSMKLFPETQTIWSYDVSFEEDSFELVGKTEFLWQWEGNRLVKRRECKFTESDRGVRITATDCDAGVVCVVLFDEFISAGEWEESAGKVQALYERFYVGYVPEETYGLQHSYWSGKEYVPGELVEKIADSMQNGTESECLEAMMNDRELTDEEKSALAETNPDLRLEIISAQSLLMVEADVDHDGINDIFAQSYYGGSGGFVDFILFKGKEDGSFEGSDRFGSVMQEFGIISFEGRNYLCRTDFDYGKKQYNGFSVSCYEDGKIVETVMIRLSADSYDVKVTECDERYTDLAQDSMSKALLYKNDIDAYENVLGSAEEGTEENPEMTWEFQCDLDNDGRKEVYGKKIWTTSNMGTVDGLSMQGEDEDDEGMKQAEEAVFSGEGNPIMMWVDAWKGKNIVTVMYRTGLEDFEIVGYYVKEDGYEQVYRIEAAAVYGVKTERESPYTEEYYGPEFMG